jgi:hypothetical protein
MLFGGLLLAVGLIVMLLSGLCSLAFWVMFLFEPGGFDLSLLFTPLLVGGIPFLMGFGLFVGGRALVREARRDEESR